jgi:hypothetical protein
MADEDQAIASSGQETATAPAATPDEPVRIPGPLEAIQEQQTATDALDDDHVEIDWEDGQKYRIPKPLKDGVLRYKDYHQKRQADADAARNRSKELDARQQASDEELDARSELRRVNTQLENYSQLTQQDWDYHDQTRPMEAGAAWREYQLLKDQKASLEGKLTEAATKRSAEAEQAIANRVQETMKYASEKIPGFKPEQIDLVVQFLDSHGYTEDEIKTNWSPRFYELAFHGMLGKALLAKQAAAARSPAPAPAPLTTVGGKSTPAARTALEDASMDDYVRRRKAGEGGKPLQ